MNLVCADFIVPDKANLVIDGSFGSTGKGLIAARIAIDNHIDIACTTTSPNAGHTFYLGVQKNVTHLIPVAGIIHRRSIIIFSAESVIDPGLLKKEMDDFDIDPCRVFIHPRAAIITDQDKESEKANALVEIASTQSGTGSARSSKILRTGMIAGCHEFCKPMLLNFSLKQILDENHGLSVLVETGQGVGLDINHGYQFPHCTSRSVMPATILGELGLPPRLMGNCMLSFRTFPIRVGNPKQNGDDIGYSGDFYPDSKEIDFKTLGVDDELTTVTKRKRRIATFSAQQYETAINLIEPTHVFLNFCNYLYAAEDELPGIESIARPTHIGVGPYISDVYRWESDILQRIYK